MSRSIFSAALFIGACLCCTASAPAAQTVTTYLNRPQQVIEGWGTSLAHFQGSASHDIYATDAFRNAYRDLGLNILRVDMQKEMLAAQPVGGVGPLGDDMAANIALANFTAARIATYGSMIQWLSANALEPQRVKLTGSLWTPPHWMKGPTGLSVNGIPTPYIDIHGDSVGGRLITEDPMILDQYGKYIATWVKGFEQEYGVPFYAISLQNESTFENPFNSMTLASNGANIDFNQYATALKSVKNAWEQFGLDTRVMGPHVAWFGQSPSNPYGLWQQNKMIEGVKQHQDPDLINFLDFYNANFYNGTNENSVKLVAAYWAGYEAVPAFWANYHKPPGVKDDGKPIWYSEASGENPASWAGSIMVAVKMYNALVYSNASAYVYWQLLDKKDVSEFTLLDQSQLDDPHQSKKYDAYKHFSRYIRPGAVRFDATFTDGASTTGGNSIYDTDSSLNVSAFYHPDDHRLTYVLINMLDVDEAVTLVLPQGLDPAAFELFRTSETENFAELGQLAVVDGQVVYLAPARSVTTLTAADVAAILLAGDANNDGLVNVADFFAVESNLGATGSNGGFLLGDANDDGRVDGDDWLSIEQHFGDSLTTGPPVPQPGTGPTALLLCGLLANRRRSNRTENTDTLRRQRPGGGDFSPRHLLDLNTIRRRRC